MASLILTLATLGLLAGFIALTQYEAHRGHRFLSGWRTQLDTDIEQAQLIVKHVDLSSFFHEETKRLINRTGHVSTHVTLQGVRAAERKLTHWVRHFRTQSGHPTTLPPRENAREFVRKLSDFKGDLKATHPDISDIV